MIARVGLCLTALRAHHVAIGNPYLLSRQTKASCGGPETDSNDIGLTADRTE